MQVRTELALTTRKLQQSEDALETAKKEAEELQAESEKARAMSSKEAAELGRLRRKIKVLEEVRVEEEQNGGNEYKIIATHPFRDSSLHDRRLREVALQLRRLMR